MADDDTVEHFDQRRGHTLGARLDATLLLLAAALVARLLLIRRRDLCNTLR